MDEIASVLGPQDAEVFSFIYGVTKTGNFEGSRSILRVARSLEETALRFWLSQDDLAQKLHGWKAALYRERLRRPRPATDEKILTSWNGLAISALAKASTVIGDERYAEAAGAAADFVLDKLCVDGRLLRRFAGGEAALTGTLEDYSFFMQGLLDLFEAKGEPKWLREAMRLNGVMVEALWDKDEGAFFMTGQAVPARVKGAYDGSTPSGNSVAAINLMRLAELTGNEALREKGVTVLKVFADDLERQPSAHANMLSALQLQSTE